MWSKRTFRDGCVSFAEPLVTSVKYFEPEQTTKPYTTTVLDNIRFKRQIQTTETLLSPIIQRNIQHYLTCKLTDHYKCKIGPLQQL